MCSYDDINTLALPVLRHRIKLGFEAVTSKMSADDVVLSLVRDLNSAGKGAAATSLGLKTTAPAVATKSEEMLKLSKKDKKKK